MSDTSLVRISNKSKRTLEELAKQSGRPMLSIMDSAIEVYRRRDVLEETNRAYERLRADEKASREFDLEIQAWDATLADGLPREDWTGETRNPKKLKGRTQHAGAKTR